MFTQTQAQKPIKTLFEKSNVEYVNFLTNFYDEFFQTAPYDFSPWLWDLLGRQHCTESTQDAAVEQPSAIDSAALRRFYKLIRPKEKG